MNANNNEKSYTMEIRAIILDERQITKLSVLPI